MSVFEQYPCVGICEDDPDSGYCVGCGRPPAPAAGPLPATLLVDAPPILAADAADGDCAARCCEPYESTDNAARTNATQ